MAVDDLHEGYYLDNFTYLLSFVTDRYADLLTADETAFAETFAGMSQDARRLYVRLISRKGPLFRADKLRYPEIGSIPDAIDELVRHEFLDTAPEMEVEEIIPLLTKAEIVKLGEGAWSSSLRRDDLVELCSDAYDADDIVEAMDLTVLEPLMLEHVFLYRLLFFGNGYQDFTEFVLHELGIAPYESYPLDDNSRFFDSRDIIEESVALYSVSDEAHEVIEAGDPDEMVAFEQAMPAVTDERLERRAGKIRNRIARELERHDRLEEALDIYGRSNLAPARERSARILARIGDVDAVMERLRAIVADPDDEAEYEFAIAFGHRVAKKHGADTTGIPAPTRCPPATEHIVVRPEPDARVEELARTFYEDAGHDAFYVENGLLPGLFGLAFWDIIFHPVPGVFFNPFQRGPADLFTPDFRDVRSRLIDDRLRCLADREAFRARVLETWHEKRPTANHFVHWGLIDEVVIERTFERIPTSHLLAVFHRLLRDPRANRAGLPDLVVFPKAGGYRLLEVKGPGDTLQNNQKRWLSFFYEKEIPAAIVHVAWQS